MNNNELHDLLEKLHNQIEHSQSLSQQEIDQLRHLEGDIRGLLERSTDHAASSPPTIINQLENAIAAFEITHPTLAVTINELMAILSNAGI
jgi:hypothetical protein